MRKHFILLLFFCAFFSCEKNKALQENEKVLLIASKKADCVGLGQQECFLVKGKNQENWEYLYEAIINFNYETGFEYEVLILEEQIDNPPQDASSIKRTLIKVVSKEQKVSENLPN